MGDNVKRKCLKCGSSPGEDPDIKLYRFPNPGATNSYRCETWAKFCFSDGPWYSIDFQKKLYSEHRMLCYRHFEKASFANFAEKKLFRKAVPDIANTECVATKKQKHDLIDATTEQWEMWKQKEEIIADGNFEIGNFEEIVDSNFENESKEAIVLSNLDYEENKDVYKQLNKDTECEKILEEQAQPGNNKQNKKIVMSLEQYNEMVTDNEELNSMNATSIKTADNQKPADKDKVIFIYRIQNKTKNELLKEKSIKQVQNQSIPEKVLNGIQLAEALEKKDKEIIELKKEISTLKEELLTVKSSNKKLCNILGQGAKRLRGVQAELNAELASLHTEFETECSKNVDCVENIRNQI